MLAVISQPKLSPSTLRRIEFTHGYHQERTINKTMVSHNAKLGPIIKEINKGKRR